MSRHRRHPAEALGLVIPGRIEGQVWSRPRRRVPPRPTACVAGRSRSRPRDRTRSGMSSDAETLGRGPPGSGRAAGRSSWGCTPWVAVSSATGRPSLRWASTRYRALSTGDLQTCRLCLDTSVAYVLVLGTAGGATAGVAEPLSASLLRFAAADMEPCDDPVRLSARTSSTRACSNVCRQEWLRWSRHHRSRCAMPVTRHVGRSLILRREQILPASTAFSRGVTSRVVRVGLP